MTAYISTRANAYGRSASKPAIKHIVSERNTTLCGKILSDPYTIRVGGHDLCPKCAKLAGRS